MNVVHITWTLLQQLNEEVTCWSCLATLQRRDRVHRVPFRINRWTIKSVRMDWHWSFIPTEFHGLSCTSCPTYCQLGYQSKLKREKTTVVVGGDSSASTSFDVPAPASAMDMREQPTCGRITVEKLYLPQTRRPFSFPPIPVTVRKGCTMKPFWIVYKAMM